MPNPSRPASQHDSPSDAHPYFQPNPDTVANQSNPARQHGNRRKKGSSRDTNILQDADETSAAEITLGHSPPARGSSIIGQIPYSFPRSQRNAPPPLLDALGPTEKVSDRDVSDRHDGWAQSAPYGKSPPTGPVKDMNVNEFTADQQIRGGFNNKSPPVSPPQRKVRPVSYGSNVRPMSARKSFSETGYRYTASAYGSSPPLPHLPQPHFYRAPDIDLGLGSRFRELSVDRAASFVGFSDLPSAAANARTNRTQIMLLGSDSRLDILAVDNKTASPIGALEHLAGQVIDAAFLTWESGNDPFRHLRPLVVVTIHGPKVNDDQTADQDDSDVLEHSEIFPAIPTPSTAANEVNEEFQTRVEVYSLVDRAKVATLFKTQPVPMQPSVRGYPRSAPPATGDLRLNVGGNFVTVSSGTSGEVWAFGLQSSRFRCLGKFWTAVQANEVRRSSSSGGYLDRDISPADLEASHRPSEHPILALSSRWLAICPAGPVSRPSLAGSITPILAAAKVPGLDSYTAPPRPSETCILDSPDAPSLLNRVARGVAQEVVKGARWLGDQSLQTWNSYWRKDQHPQSPQTSPYNQPVFSADQHPNFFPPTHAQETRSASEPELVSIVDLKRLQDGPSKKGVDPLTPLATFQPPGGCSFLSFAPSGLNLLTASRKGDVQYVWDLMQIKHCRAAAFINTQSDATQSVSPEVSPRVGQIAKFPRLTSSSVVDVVWSPPVGDRLAVITRNGTVHVFDLPLSAFQWPPLRRGPRAGPVSAPASPAVHPQREEVGPAGGVLASAMRLASKTQPMLANLRGRAPSVGGGVSGISTNSIGFASVAGVRSGKAVAAGLSQSLEAAAGTVNTLRHAGDSRVHLSNMAKNPARARVVWGQSSVLVVDGMVVRVYRVRRAQATGKGRQSVSVVDANSAISMKLPKLGELANISTEKQGRKGEGPEERLDGTVSGYWTSRSSTAPNLSLEDFHPLSRAEIETNAPYQPFHSDRRVSLFVHSASIILSESQIPTASVIFHGADTPITPEKWVFGNELPATKLHLRSSTYDTFDEGGEGDPAAQIYRQTTTEGDGENEQIVSTTKPRKGKRGNASVSMSGANGGLEDAEELDFEDDVEFLDYATDRV
jgi:hypothetical protein